MTVIIPQCKGFKIVNKQFLSYSAVTVGVAAVIVSVTLPLLASFGCRIHGSKDTVLLLLTANIARITHSNVIDGKKMTFFLKKDFIFLLRSRFHLRYEACFFPRLKKKKKKRKLRHSLNNHTNTSC
jgi:hypothetical protein